MVAEVSGAALDRKRVALFLRGETTQRKPIGQLVLFRLAAVGVLVDAMLERQGSEAESICFAHVILVLANVTVTF